MKIYVTGNKKIKDGSIEKYFVPISDGHKSIEMYPGEVIYDAKIQENKIAGILNFLEHISEAYHSITNKNKNMGQDRNRLEKSYNDYFGSAIRILINQIKLFKNPVFTQDEEYRIIFDVNSKLDVIKYRQFKGVFFPYVEVVFDIKKLPINSITIGPKNNLDIAAKGLSQFLQSQGYRVTLKSEYKDKDKILIRKSGVPFRY
jgi:hypothetical protein